MKEFLKRNKKVLLYSLVLFVVFAIAGAVYGFLTIGDNFGAITNAITNMPPEEAAQSRIADVTMDSVELFFHNLASDIVVVLGGFLFSVISVIVVAFNALAIGIPFGSDPVFSAVTILPHGIIEYAASIAALAAAFKITSLEIKMIKQRSFRSVIDENRQYIKDIAILLLIMVVLLAVAAVIEGNVTGILADRFFGII